MRSYRLPKVPPIIKANAILSHKCSIVIFNCQIIMEMLTPTAIAPNNHSCHPPAWFKKLKAAPVLKVKNRLNIGKILIGSPNGK